MTKRKRRRKARVYGPGRIDPTKHRGLVYEIVGSMVRVSGSSMYDDLVCEGMVWMIEAARRYDPARGVTFATYAATYIRGGVLSAIRDQMGAVRLPRCRWAHGERPAVSHSLEQPILPDGDETSTPANRIADERRPSSFEAVALEELRRLVRAEVEALPPALRKVIESRFDDELTLRETGELLDVTRQGAQKCERRALDLLRYRLTRILAGTTV